MNKQELLAVIKELPDDIVFLISSDDEGNSFRALYSLEASWGFDDGINIEPVHPDDAKDYIDSGQVLTKVATFW